MAAIAAEHIETIGLVQQFLEGAGQLYSLAGVEAEVLAHYWRQALTKAVAARELCEQLWHSPGEEAFLAGLVQDIGVLVLLKELGGSYQQLWSHAQTHGCSLLECELDTLG